MPRGLSTDEIAGELTSKLFAEHYHAPLNDAIYASAERIAARVASAD